MFLSVLHGVTLVLFLKNSLGMTHALLSCMTILTMINICLALKHVSLVSLAVVQG